jgi:Fes/CIP4/EFC/F-BAR domain-containing protein
VKTVSAFYEERAKIEREFAKKLKKLAQSHVPKQEEGYTLFKVPLTIDLFLN